MVSSMASGGRNFDLQKLQKSFAVSAITFLAEIHEFVRVEVAGDGKNCLWMAKKATKIGYFDYARPYRSSWHVSGVNPFWNLTPITFRRRP
jgi:hypothetical protein